MATPLDRSQPGSESALSFGAMPRPTQISAHIAAAIQERIATGEIPLGARLPSEADLSRDFAVSRPSVREALAALQFVGLVESRRGYGTVVVSREPTVGGPATGSLRPLGALVDAVDLLEARLVLEPAAMAIAALDPNPAALASARELIDGMAVAIDDVDLHASTDIRVHHALLDICRNSVLRESARDLLGMALDPILLSSRTKAWSSPELPHVWAADHSAVHAAIESGHPEAARAACESHLASVATSLALAVQDEPDLLDRVAALARRHAIGARLRLQPPSDPPPEGRKL